MEPSHSGNPAWRVFYNSSLLYTWDKYNIPPEAPFATEDRMKKLDKYKRDCDFSVSEGMTFCQGFLDFTIKCMSNSTSALIWVNSIRHGVMK